MRTGLLWFDNSCKTTLEEKVMQAAGYFAGKYNQRPNCCHVSHTVTDAPICVGSIMVKTDPMVSPGYLWIGVEETEKHGERTGRNLS